MNEDIKKYNMEVYIKYKNGSCMDISDYSLHNLLGLYTTTKLLIDKDIVDNKRCFIIVNIDDCNFDFVYGLEEFISWCEQHNETWRDDCASIQTTE